MQSPIQPDQFLRVPEVLRLIGVKKSWLYAHVRAGRFPAPVKLSKRATAWRASDIARWQTEIGKRG